MTTKDWIELALAVLGYAAMCVVNSKLTGPARAWAARVLDALVILNRAGAVTKYSLPGQPSPFRAPTPQAPAIPRPPLVPDLPQPKDDTLPPPRGENSAPDVTSPSKPSAIAKAREQGGAN